jgi:dihydroorotate dehydrogenase electron transfer subunit
MKQTQCKILSNEKLGAGFYRMRVASTYLAKNSKPGQFAEIRCAKATDPLLRRPFGIHRTFTGGVEFLYEVVGKGTELLAGLEKDKLLDVIGPLGHGFDIRPKRGTSILVAGGNGVAPLLFLAEKLAAKKEKAYVLIGGCSKSHILCEEDFKKTGAKVLITTEDGTRGYKGLITHLLHKMFTSYELRHAAVYACGPTGMLKAVAKIAQDNLAACQVSLEEHMACGVGVCLGCPVRIKRGRGLQGAGYEYKMVCKDGPVFDAKDVLWE